jgi:phosphoglycerol transferase MdoB-like AlkP superfamily enzyme
MFENAYEVGGRSLLGLCASLTGIPLLPGMIFAHSIETSSDKSSLAKALKKFDYHSIFAQSSKRSSMMMCDLAKNRLGFEESYGMEDIPMILKYKNYIQAGYDYELFDFTAKKIDGWHKKGKRFMAYLFTGATHVPFFDTNGDFEKYPPNSQENKYLNSLYYADFSIGHFIDEAKKSGWFDNTVFVFMADHSHGYAHSPRDKFESVRIPFIIYAPKILAAKRIDYAVSQLDLIPTLYHLLGISEPFSAMGVNALDERSNHFAIANQASDIILIKDGNYIAHNRQAIMEKSLRDEDKDKIFEYEDMLLSIDKTVCQTIRKNKWYKSER